MDLNIEHALQQGVAAHNQGNLSEAESYYRAILKAQPQHPEALHNLGLIAFSANQYAAALPLLKRALDTNSEIEQFWCSYISALTADNRQESAAREIEAARRKGFIIEMPGDLGSQQMRPVGGSTTPRSQLDDIWEHFQNGRYDAAKSLADSVVTRFPDNSFIWKILGAVNAKLGRADDALIANENAVRLDPLSSEAHYNLALNLQDKGRLDESVSSYIKAIDLNPEALEPSSNLINLLTTYVPEKEISHPIVKVDRDIKESGLMAMTPDPISDDAVLQIFNRSTDIIESHDINPRTNFSEIFRRNSVDLNCERHLAIFARSNIIPEFCFGCYKVQVEPRTLLELMKLFVVFDQLKLAEDNIRKCMVEIRPKIAGFYKGLIYCSSPDEAYQIAEMLEKIVIEKISPELTASVKRGCSEYPISYPEYKEINKSGKQPMTYNQDWKAVEDEYDAIHPSQQGKTIRPSLSGLSLSDILIIRNWIDYAKGIGDPSARLFSQNAVLSQKIFGTARKRLETYPWKEAR